MSNEINCPLCEGKDETVLYRNRYLRVIDAGDPDYPAFTRVVWNRHATEMTDLDMAEQHALMAAVALVEAVQRRALAPHKINLAQFGNMVPHMHWHVIPRFVEDPHFPNPTWGPRRAFTPQQDLAWSTCRQSLQARLPAYREQLRQAFAQCFDASSEAFPTGAIVEAQLQHILSH